MSESETTTTYDVAFHNFLLSLEAAYVRGDPFAAICIGDAEAMFYLMGKPGQPKVPNLDVYLRPNGVLSYMTGLRDDWFEMLPEADFTFANGLNATLEYEHRMRSSELLWEPFTVKCAETLDLAGSTSPRLPAELRYEMFSDGSCLAAISGAKVLLIGALADQAAKSFTDKDFLMKHAEKCTSCVEVVGSLKCSSTLAAEDVYRVIERSKEYDFDVALVAMGPAANYVCLSLKRLGHIALDVGSVMDAFAGVAPERTGLYGFDNP